ncbi:hypothetical protein AB395_00005164 (plasmid) [Sinorhizobium fredii CCBAU 45436]|nr:hypothetical protein AB395_00005164 [Sinorhizobium fredii CCBAU 45436]
MARIARHHTRSRGHTNSVEISDTFGDLRGIVGTTNERFPDRIAREVGDHTTALLNERTGNHADTFTSRAKREGLCHVSGLFCAGSRVLVIE